MVQKRPFSGNTRDLSADPDRSRVGADFREYRDARLSRQGLLQGGVWRPSPNGGVVVRNVLKVYFNLPDARPVQVKSWSWSNWFGQWSSGDTPTIGDRETVGGRGRGGPGAARRASARVCLALALLYEAGSPSKISVEIVTPVQAEHTVNLTPAAQKFVLYWGEMGQAWGINRTMARTSPKPQTPFQLESLQGLASDGFVPPPAIEPNHDMWRRRSRWKSC